MRQTADRFGSVGYLYPSGTTNGMVPRQPGWIGALLVSQTAWNAGSSAA
jgi:hypothetical protein